MAQMLTLSMRQLAGRWRVFLILLLAVIPVAVTALIRASGGADGSQWEDAHIDGFIDGMIVGAIMPIVVMALATASFGNELEDRTLSYLVLKPIARFNIVLPKLMASVVLAGPLLVASGVLTTVIGRDAGVRTPVAVAIALLAGVVGYAAIFTWAGLMTRSALPFALLYVLLWEGLMSSLLGGIRYLSIRGYTLAIMHGIDEEGLDVLADRVIEFPAAIGGAALVTLAFFSLTVYRLHKMDVP